MRFLNNIYLLLTILTLGLFSSCNDDKVTSEVSEMGYVQVRILPELTTRSITLETLADVKKVELSLLYKDMKVVQTLSMSGVIDAVDNGITSERLELASGEYTLLSYRLLGSVQLGEDKPEELMVIHPSTATYFDITAGHIHELELEVSSKLRGKVSFQLDKDLSNYQDIMDEVNSSTRATNVSPELFKYDLISEADIYIKKKGTNERPALLSLKTYSLNSENFRHTDTISIESGEYEITSYMLYSRNRIEMILAMDLTDTYFTVEANRFNRASMEIKYPENIFAIRDYVALYNIWKALDGENWSYAGYFLPEGANWRFKNRPIDEWGNQPGVTLSSKGRVIALSIGDFCPAGDVPACIGDLTELQQLWLGLNSDISVFESDEIVYSLNRAALAEEGVDIFKERINIAKEELSLRYNKDHLYTLRDNKDISTNYARTFTKKKNATRNSLDKTNKITSIPEEIGNLTRLNLLYIANNYVKELPASLVNLTELTDMELYNCDFEKFPEVLYEMKSLILINISANSKMPQQEINKGMNEFLRNATELQILYATDNNMSEFPQNMMYAKKIGYIDFAFNSLTELPNLERAISPVKAYFEFNKITSIHDRFCDTDDIEDISFASNLITEVPNLFGNGSGSATKYTIESIDFSNNLLKTFKSDFAGVRVNTFNLSGNKFGENGALFPDALANTKSPVSFLLIDNCELDTLPNSAFKNLTALEALQAKGNNLKTIPPVFNVEELPYLSGMDLSFNKFREVPVQPFYIHNMNKFYIKGQFDVDKRGNIYRCMTKFISGLNKHPGIKYLDVSDNNITSISATDFPGSIFSFDIRNNPNIEVNVSSFGCNNIALGCLQFIYDPTQYILDCPYVELED